MRTGGLVWNMIEFLSSHMHSPRVAHADEMGWALLDIASRSRPTGFLLYAGFAIHLDFFKNAGRFGERGGLSLTVLWFLFQIHWMETVLVRLGGILPRAPQRLNRHSRWV